MSRQTPVFLVTGGARRVGRHLAMHFARLGYDIALTYRTSSDEAVAVAEAVQQLGRQCLAVQADFASDDAADKVAAAVEARFDRLDVLVHNASVYEPIDLNAMTPQLLRRDLRVHVETPLLLTRRLRPMLAKAKGLVVGMTDVDLARSRPSFLTYQISKAGLATAMANLARELAPDIRVNCIAPGAVLWPPEMPESDQERYLSRVPLGRVGTPQDVASAVEFLATTGTYLTGETLRLDGGRHLR
jgi:pteridine reductase